MPITSSPIAAAPASGVGSTDAPTSPAIYVASSDVFGDWSDEAPVTLSSVEEAGHAATSFLDLYYYRLWIIASTVNFGRVLSPETEEVEAWNSFFEPRNFGPVVATGDTEGQTLTGDTAAGTFAKLESKMYTLSASRLGSSRISVIYDWQMQGLGDTASVLTVLGVRLIAFLLRHNWLEPVLEQLSFKTTVLTGMSGVEQRIKLRQSPRRRLEMSYLTLTDEERMYLEHAMHSQNIVFAVPLWSDTGPLNVAASIGATVFQVNTIDRDYEAGGLMFLQSGETSETLEIVSFTASTVTTLEPSVNAFPAGAKVCPARFGIMERQQAVKRVTSTVEKSRIAWQLDTNTDRPNMLEAYTPATYLGLEIYDEQNDYGQAHDIEQTAKSDWADNEVGTIEIVTGEPYPRRSYPFYKLMSRDELPVYLQWFYNRSGKYTPFYWNDHVRAMRMVEGTALDSVFLNVKSLGYGEFMFDNEARRQIAILTSGGWIYRSIEDAEVNEDGTTTLTLDSAPGVELTVLEDPKICLMRRVRLDSDMLDVTWFTSDTVRTATRFIDVF